MVNPRDIAGERKKNNKQTNKQTKKPNSFLTITGKLSVRIGTVLKVFGSLF